MAPRGFCEDCKSEVLFAVSELTADYVRLTVAARMGMTPGMTDMVSLSRDLPIPLCLTYSTIAEQIECEVTAYAEPVAELARIDWDRRTAPDNGGRYRKGLILSWAADLLCRRPDIFLELPCADYLLWGERGQLVVTELDGLDAALRLHALHRLSRAALGLTLAIWELPSPCPACRTGRLARFAGRDGVTCQRCGQTWADEDYQRWTLVQLHENRDRVPG